MDGLEKLPPTADLDQVKAMVEFCFMSSPNRTFSIRNLRVIIFGPAKQGAEVKSGQIRKAVKWLGKRVSQVDRTSQGPRYQLNQSEIQFIRDVTNYKIPKDTKKLVDDWRILLSWYTRWKTGKPFKYTSEQLVNLAVIILRELIKRKIKLKPSTYTPAGQELYNRALRVIQTGHFTPGTECAKIPTAELSKYATVHPGGTSKGDRVYLQDIIKEFKPFFRRKPIAYLVGGLVIHGSTTGDIDVLIMRKERDIGLEFRIYRQFDKSLWPRFQFIYDPDQGPYTDYIPIYDELFTVHEPMQKVEMAEHDRQLRLNYVGAKAKMMQYILRKIPDDVKVIVDPFAGSCATAYGFKQAGYQVYMNDILYYSRNIQLGLVKNNSVRLSDDDIEMILNSKQKKGYLHSYKERQFYNPSLRSYIDGCIASANTLKHSVKKALARVAIISTLFTLSSHSGGSYGRISVNIPKSVSQIKRVLQMKLKYVNKMVIPGPKCSTAQQDAVQYLATQQGDLVYLDPPYISEVAEQSLYRRYTLSDAILLQKEVVSRDDWKKSNFEQKMKKLLEQCKKFKYIMLSYKKCKFYSPGRLRKLLLQYKSNVRLFRFKVKYTTAPQGSKERDAVELLFIATNAQNFKFANFEELFYKVPGYKELADKSKVQDKIIPGRPFYLAKPMHGRTKEEIYSPDTVLKVIKKRKTDWFKVGVICERKFDGVSVWIHKKGNKVKVITDDGGDITKNMPSIVDDVKRKWPWDLVVGAEIEMVKDSKHQPRADTNGVLHSKAVHSDEKFLIANFYDILYVSPVGDIHKLQFNERLKHLDKKPQTDRLKRSERKLARSEKDLRRLIEYFSKRPGSEGCMMKLLTFKYPLSGRTYENIKFKKELSLDLKVWTRMGVKGTDKTFYYITTLKDGILAGKTFNTNIKAKNGDILKVVFVDISKYHDPVANVDWFELWNPRVVEKRTDKKTPDTAETALKMVHQTTGRIAEKRVPKSIREATKDSYHGYHFGNAEYFAITSDKIPMVKVTGVRKCPKGKVAWKGKCIPRYSFESYFKPIECEPGMYHLEEIDHDEEFADPFMYKPPEDGKYRFVLQAHIRGKSVHLDDRRQIDKNRAIGMTHFIGEKQLSKAPESYQEAKELYYREIHPRVLQHLKDPKQKLLSGKKSVIPIEWLNVQGKVEKGGVGATRHEYGYFIIIDKGEVEFMALKPYFHEMYYHGRILQGKYIDRLIENRKEWRKSVEGPLAWMFFYTKNPPYVLTSRAVKKGWLPPKSHSALPRHIRNQIPKQYQYWKSDDVGATRNALRKAMRKEVKIKMDFDEPVKSVGYILMKQTWRGQIVTRLGPSKTIYHLLLKDRSFKGKVPHFMLSYNPADTDSLTAYSQPLTYKEAGEISTSGHLPPSSKFNPKKKISSTLSRTAQGEVVIFNWDATFKKIKFKGQLTGMFTLQRERPKSNIWLMKRTQTAPKTVMEIFSSFEEDGFRWVEGMLFHAGMIKGLPFEKKVLRKAVLIPKKGHSLCYANWYHLGFTEEARTGLLTKIWWDENHKWRNKETDDWEKGAVLFRSIVTDPKAVKKIDDCDVLSVSPEITYDEVGTPHSDNWSITAVYFHGYAHTTAPACKECAIFKSCDNKSCKILS